MIARESRFQKDKKPDQNLLLVAQWIPELMQAQAHHPYRNSVEAVESVDLFRYQRLFHMQRLFYGTTIDLCFLDT